MELCQEDSTAYWKGLWHGLLLMLPVLTFLYRKWGSAAEKSAVQQPVLGYEGQQTETCCRARVHELTNLNALCVVHFYVTFNYAVDAPSERPS
ncbi:hypothetical protein PF005_g18249 [Phytophthora fragariae]|uniref:Uncharacterized protein n=1 Tax=Phytophthora fragariae TaxID=53985 RepID=A0A6A3EEH7_9STRA|nr:hypothetical protein PF009_g19209 [Phytophthora fragariae]KAE8993990.1 hypothetical protein PF011_g16910 [Phytophthora fragariae]KAE9093364.1 hypothetical protein PF007_g18157 [Phytophthora fragariae]KAE9093482.1 hypothetical protein PF010_g17467 [Phytophthora fragariae]KAE9128716.1 hypothetical protein PF006_g16211 [Phytophthora fragariae]